MQEEQEQSASGKELSINCEICFEKFSKIRRFPISLCCGHTFCAACIRVLSANRSNIQCSVCRKITYNTRPGKNILLFDILLERNHLLDDTEDVAEDAVETQWLQQQNPMFLSMQEFELLHENLDSCRVLLEQIPSTHESRYRFWQTLRQARHRVRTIENQLNSIGQTYAQTLSEIENIQNEMRQQISAMIPAIIDRPLDPREFTPFFNNNWDWDQWNEHNDLENEENLYEMELWRQVNDSNNGRRRNQNRITVSPERFSNGGFATIVGTTVGTQRIVTNSPNGFANSDDDLVVPPSPPPANWSMMGPVQPIFRQRRRNQYHNNGNRTRQRQIHQETQSNTNGEELANYQWGNGLNEQQDSSSHGDMSSEIGMQQQPHHAISDDNNTWGADVTSDRIVAFFNGGFGETFALDAMDHGQNGENWNGNIRRQRRQRNFTPYRYNPNPVQSDDEWGSLTGWESSDETEQVARSELEQLSDVMPIETENTAIQEVQQQQTIYTVDEDDRSEYSVRSSTSDSGSELELCYFNLENTQLCGILFDPNENAGNDEYENAIVAERTNQMNTSGKQQLPIYVENGENQALLTEILEETNPTEQARNHVNTIENEDEQLVQQTSQIQAGISTNCREIKYNSAENNHRRPVQITVRKRGRTAIHCKPGCSK